MKASARSIKPSARSVLLRFDPDGAPSATGESLQGELSVVLQVRDDLWLASDESASIERLSPGKGRVFEHHTGFLLADYLSLPAGDDAEVDIEGMAHERNYLWVVGSHSLSRRKADASSKHSKKQIRALAEVRTGGNRYLLARIPLMADSGGVSHQLFKTCPDPDDPTRTLSAAQLMGGDRGNLLTDALQDDEHLAPFLGIPGKENGFNIEGLGVVDGRLFIGLRGPVIGGWAVVLEIEVEPVSDTFLRLKPIGKKGRRYKKHFLDLRGLGIRELCRDGPDLLVLAGPTMQLDGDAAVFRWKDVEDLRGECLVGRDDLTRVLKLPYGPGDREDTDHPEGMTVYAENGRRRSVLVVYDSPREARKVGGSAVRADVFELP